MNPNAVINPRDKLSIEVQDKTSNQSKIIEEDLPLIRLQTGHL
jgi:hypothetical protein